MTLDAIFTLDSQTLKNYLVNPFDSYNYQFRSSRSIILGLYDSFPDLSRFAFTMPESLKSDKQLFKIENRKFVPVSDSFEASLLMILGVDAEDPKHSFEDLELQYSIYNSLNSDIGRFSNSLDSKFKIEKGNLYNYIDSNFMPKKFDFSSWDDLKDLITQEESVVLKKVSGANGDQVYLLNNLTFDKMKSSLLEDSLSNYIAQETLDIVAEKRMIFFGEDMVATRVISDRYAPWEKRGEVSSKKRNQVLSTYTPSSEELKRGLDFSKRCNLDYSTVDFVIDSSGKEYLMELNGIHPGMIGSLDKNPGLYDLGTRFAKFIKEDLLNN